MKIAESIKSQVLPLYKTGLTQSEVAEKLGISKPTVSRIIRSTGYDRIHVGSTIAKSVPVSPIAKAPERPKADFRTVSRTLKLASAATGFSYKISTETDIVEIEGESALIQINVSMVDQFITELTEIKAMLGNPS